jgi:hypothetical protein
MDPRQCRRSKGVAQIDWQRPEVVRNEPTPDVGLGRLWKFEPAHVGLVRDFVAAGRANNHVVLAIAEDFASRVG